MTYRTIRAASAAVCYSALLLCLTGCGGKPSAGGPDSRDKLMTRGETPRRGPRDDFEKTGDAPINANTHFAAGELAETQDSQAKAEDQYRKALKLDPNHQGSLFRLGVMYAKQKKFAEAIEAWKGYVRATNGDAAGLANLGFAYELAGRTDEAETAYLRGIKKDPLNAPCRVNYGLMLARHGRFSEASLEMQAVLTEAEVHYNLAAVYELANRREQAKVEYRKALAADPQMTEAQAKLDVLP